jgi:hypothetical protein
MQPLQQVLGILPSRINANVQMQMRMFACELLEGLLEFLITFCSLGEMERWGRGAFLFVPKRHMMGITGGVDPDADRHRIGRDIVCHDDLREKT